MFERITHNQQVRDLRDSSDQVWSLVWEYRDRVDGQRRAIEKNCEENGALWADLRRCHRDLLVARDEVRVLEEANSALRKIAYDSHEQEEAAEAQRDRVLGETGELRERLKTAEEALAGSTENWVAREAELQQLARGLAADLVAADERLELARAKARTERRSLVKAFNRRHSKARRAISRLRQRSQADWSDGWDRGWDSGRQQGRDEHECDSAGSQPGTPTSAYADLDCSEIAGHLLDTVGSLCRARSPLRDLGSAPFVADRSSDDDTNRDAR